MAAPHYPGFAPVPDRQRHRAGALLVQESRATELHAEDSVHWRIGEYGDETDWCKIGQMAA